MSFDLFFKRSPRNWARRNNDAKPNPFLFVPGKQSAPGVPTSSASPGTSPAGTSPEAQAKIAEIQAIKKAAEGGDKKATKRWRRMSKKIDKIRKKAAKGDPRAIRALSLLGPAGVATSLALTASRGEFVGKDEILGEFVGKDEILGEFVGDEARANNEIGYNSHQKFI